MLYIIWRKIKIKYRKVCQFNSHRNSRLFKIDGWLRLRRKNTDTQSVDKNRKLLKAWNVLQFHSTPIPSKLGFPDKDGIFAEIGQFNFFFANRCFEIRFLHFTISNISTLKLKNLIFLTGFSKKRAETHLVRDHGKSF